MRPHPLLLAILTVMPGCSETVDTTGCIGVDEETTTCPAAGQVPLESIFLTSICNGDDIEIVKVKGEGRLTQHPGGTVTPGCCYTVEVIDDEPDSECIAGRPFWEGHTARVAPIRLGYSQNLVSESACVQVESSRERAIAWAQAGAAEHASIAAFNRLSLQLMALGAPLELVEGVQRAALEEVHHARACWKIAQDLSGGTVEVGAFPFQQPIDAKTTLADLAYAAVREGCLAETLGACVTQSIAPHAATDVRFALTRLADEEAEHAVLSFRLVSWALQVGGKAVRDSVVAALSEPWPALDTFELAVRTGVSQEAVQAAARAATLRVLEPAARALLS